MLFFRTDLAIFTIRIALKILLVILKISSIKVLLTILGLKNVYPMSFLTCA